MMMTGQWHVELYTLESCVDVLIYNRCLTVGGNYSGLLNNLYVLQSGEGSSYVVLDVKSL